MSTIRIYMDESGGDAAFVAGGWACPAERWDSISHSWQAVLDADPQIDYFRLNEAMGLKGQFQGWTIQRRDDKMKALIEVLPHEPRFFGHGAYVSSADFEKIKNCVRNLYRNPYFFCIATAMVFAAAGETQILGADKVDFILDQSKEAKRMRELFYSDIKPRFPKLGECIYLDDKITNPLQAADLGAAALRQLNEPVPRPIPHINILNGIFAALFELRGKHLEEMLATSLFKKKSSRIGEPDLISETRKNHLPEGDDENSPG